jgi:hypothetical protein
MRIMTMAVLAGLTAPPMATQAQRQAVVRPGENVLSINPHSDAQNGHMLRVAWTKAETPVTVTTVPQINFTCDYADISECYAFLRPGITVRVTVTRAARGGGIAARGAQWKYDCVGQGSPCTVTMDKARTAMVNWIATP